MIARPMNEAISDPGKSTSRAATRQLLWLGAWAVACFAVLLLVSGWLAAHTAGGDRAKQAVDMVAKEISLAYQFEPRELDSTRATDAYSSYVLGHVMEGLLRYDEHGAIIGGVSERWEIRPDGATFHLRKDSRWSDDQPVTAKDFVFAWRRVVDPANASEYAFILYPVKNAEAVNTGKLPPDALGVRAVDDTTLEIQFERPIAFFDKLVAFKTFFPIREDFYASRKGRYGADAVDLLYNGPFTLSRWIHGASFRFEKNPRYWNPDLVHLQAIDHPYITSDTTAIMNLYKDGRVAMAGQSIGLEPDQLTDVLAHRWPISRYNEGMIWFIDFNHRQDRLTRNFHFRKAMQLVVDSTELVNQVIKLPGYAPGVSLFPAQVQGKERLFRQEYPPAPLKIDVEAARQHLALAKQELNLDAIPPISLLITDLPLNVKIGAYLQNVLLERLGLEIRLDPQIFRQRLDKMTNGDFDLVMAGWSPDFDDALTFGDLFASWNLNNRGRYSNAEVDRSVRTAMGSLDATTRMDAFGNVQRVLLEDAALIPLFERGQVFVGDKRLKGVIRRVVGTDPDFTYAYLTEDRT